jgi:hypothetical protein
MQPAALHGAEWLHRLEREIQIEIQSGRITGAPQLVVGCLAGLYTTLGQFDKALPYAERAVNTNAGDTQHKIQTKFTLAII